MQIVETPLFTRQIKDALSEEDYRAFQLALIARPDAGAVMRGGGGLRKIRWAPSGRGKSGGVRIIYYWAVSAETIYLVLVYAKNEQATLTKAQLAFLRTLIDKEVS